MASHMAWAKRALTQGPRGLACALNSAELHCGVLCGALRPGGSGQESSFASSSGSDAAGSAAPPSGGSNAAGSAAPLSGGNGSREEGPAAGAAPPPANSGAAAAAAPLPEGHIDMARKDLVMIFTCGQCETRAAKAFSKRSYYEGVVIVQCPGCDSRHLVADHLGWFGHKGTVEDFVRGKGGVVVNQLADHTMELTPEDVAGLGASAAALSQRRADVEL